MAKEKIAKILKRKSKIKMRGLKLTRKLGRMFQGG